MRRDRSVLVSPWARTDLQTAMCGEDREVYALDAATGHLRWTYTTGDQVDSGPAVAGGTVYIGSTDYTVYALKAAQSLNLNSATNPKQ